MLNSATRQVLKGQAHHLKPVVLVGSKGLTSAVIEETEIALITHELIKVKINGAEKADRIEMVNTICSELKAELVQLIGNTAIIYRKNPAI